MKQFRVKRSPVGDPERRTTVDTILALHGCVRRLLSVMPSSGAALFQAVESAYPMKYEDCHDQMIYLESVLQIASYCPEASRGALDLVVRKLLVFDVEVLSESLENSSSSVPRAADGDLTFNFDEGDEKEQKLAVDIQKANMDDLMEKMFEYIDSKNLDSITGFKSLQDYPPECAAQVEFFRNLLHVFQARVLPTRGAQFVQFLVFYACTKMPSVLPKTFISLLMNVFSDPSYEQAVRAAAIVYVGSFVARFQQISPELTMSVLVTLCEWSRDYMQKLEGRHSSPDMQAHYLFYTVCNCIFYMLCFRHNDAPSGIKYQLDAIIHGELNPLLYVQSGVFEEFFEIRCIDKLVDVSRIRQRLKQNKRVIVDGSFEISFPFDPFGLVKGEARLKRFYNAWLHEDDVIINNSRSDQDDLVDDCGDDDEDDDDSDRCRAMSLGTPITGGSAFSDLPHSSASSANSPPSAVYF